MILLRIFLYLVCFFSIGWSILVFGGPVIIEKLVLAYSNGAVQPSKIKVSPTFEIYINRLDFNINDKSLEVPVEGFSRSVEISWSIFGEEPFLDFTLGPSVWKNYAGANKINISFPSFRHLDWENALLVADVKNLTFNSIEVAESAQLRGNVNFETSRVVNLELEGQSSNAKIGGITYGAKSIMGKIDDLNFAAPASEQAITGIFFMTEITVSEPNISCPEATMEFSWSAETKNFKIDLNELMLPAIDGSVSNIKVDGSYDREHTLQNLNVDLSNGTFASNLPGFSEISTRIVKKNEEFYYAFVEGNLNNYEIANSQTFLGSLPPSSFELKLELDEKISKVTTTSQINFKKPGVSDITGSSELISKLGRVDSIKCLLLNCDLTGLELSYQFDFNGDWVKGSAQCPISFCGLTNIEYRLTTSDTAKLLESLSNSGILSPLTSLYLYGILTSGNQINKGHEINF